MNIVPIVIAFTALAVAALLSTARLIRTGSLPDRVLGLDALLLTVVASLATHAAWTGSGTFLDILVITALLSFVGTVFVAGIIKERPE